MNEVQKFDTIGTCIGTVIVNTPLAASGNTVVAGSIRHVPGLSCGHGKVYVLDYAAPKWTQTAILDSDDAQTNDMFSVAVDIDGDLVVVGAKRGDHAGPVDSGTVYVFRRIAGVWTQEQRLTAADAQATDLFGASVAVSGNVIAVGSILDDDLDPGAGSVYVFRYSGTSWVQEQKLVAGDAVPGLDFFGTTLDALNDVIAIGVPLDDDLGTSSGAAYVFRHNSGAWVLEQKLTLTGGQAGDEFGRSVSLDGQTALIGAPLSDTAAVDGGAAYVFVHSETGWSLNQTLTSHDPMQGDRFGHDVALRDSMLLVGTPADDITYPFAGYSVTASQAGSASLFVHDGSDWSIQHLYRSRFVDNGMLSTLVNYLGSAVALGPSHAVVDCPLSPSPGPAPVFQGSTQFFEFIPPDCDSNGVPDNCDTDCNHNLLNDACEIMAGSSNDCNLNAVADECEAGFQYSLDSGISSYVSYSGNTSIDFIWLNQFSVLPGGQFVTHIASPWTSLTPDGTPCTLLLYDDPNNDGDPGDAALLASANGVSYDAFGLSTQVTHTSYAIPRTYVGSIGDSFFVGVKMSLKPSMLVAPVDQNSPTRGRSWYQNAAFGQANLVNLSVNGPLTQASGNWMVRALALDCNNNGVWDQCDIDAGVSMDANGNGIPDECECVADIAPTIGGNGVVNIDDLLVVINSWGACPGNPTPCPADIAPPGGDDQVNIDDLLLVINNWGSCN